MKTWEITLLGLTFVLVCFGRLLVPGHDLSWPGTYEAFAHIWVGFVLAAWWFDRWPRILGRSPTWGYHRKPSYLCVLGIATVFEVVMFLLR